MEIREAQHHMTPSLDLANLRIVDLQREAERSRLATLVRRIAECCAPATMRGRLLSRLRTAPGS